MGDSTLYFLYIYIYILYKAWLNFEGSKMLNVDLWNFSEKENEYLWLEYEDFLDFLGGHH